MKKDSHRQIMFEAIQMVPHCNSFLNLVVFMKNGASIHFSQKQNLLIVLRGASHPGTCGEIRIPLGSEAPGPHVFSLLFNADNRQEGGIVVFGDQVSEACPFLDPTW